MFRDPLRAADESVQRGVLVIRTLPRPCVAGVPSKVYPHFRHLVPQSVIPTPERE